MTELHPWNVSASQAVKIQQQLRCQINIKPLDQPIRHIAGADISFNKGSDQFFAGIILLEYPSMTKVGHALVSFRASFPYIPGLLSFREIPALLVAWQMLPEKPDLIMLDGHGIAHPRRLGIASHFGLWVDKPSLGCAKKLLTGMHEVVPAEAPACTRLFDKDGQIGIALRTRTNVKPVYISPGHLIDFESAEEITRHCLGGYRLPEPTRQAHLLVNRLRKGQEEEGFKLYQNGVV
ncbi:MAG: deoxyribonuclease V [Cyclobacteriaceae bacterium]